MNLVIKDLPSYIVPFENIELGNITISQSKPAKLIDDWERSVPTGSIHVEAKENNGDYFDWVYFHSLLADSIYPLYVAQTENRTKTPFKLEKLNEDNGLSGQFFFDPTDVLPALYLTFDDAKLDTLTYKNLYENYLKVGTNYKAAIKNYFESTEIGFNKRLGYIDTSYWSVVMLVSAIESFLPEPVFCDGVCQTCGKSVHHTKEDSGTSWNDLIFNHIDSKSIKKQYHLILDSARWKIRNDTVHNGLMPLLERNYDSLPDGVTEMTASKAVEAFMSSQVSLESLIEQLRQVCRYVLLNALTNRKIFPELKGFEVHSKTITNITTSQVEIPLDF